MIDIKQHLKEQLKYVVSLGYSQNRVLGIFACGSMNYGFFNPETSDINSKVIIIPSFEDLCLGKEPVSKEIHFGEEHIDIKDIRIYRKMILKQNINFLEIFFTEYSIINPKYKEIFENYFLNYRHLLTNLNREQTVKSISGQAINTLKKCNGTPKNLYNGYRLYYFLQHYVEDKPYQECLKPVGEEYKKMWDIKYNCSSIYSTPEMINKVALELAKKIQELAEKNIDIESPLADHSLQILDKGCIALFKKTFSVPIKPNMKKIFFENLTHTETEAYYTILKEIKAEGTISISKMIQKYGISRPVYSNLINKLKQHNVATVTNMGVKGTYIRITDAELLVEAINYEN